jgi:hypothetical protein
VANGSLHPQTGLSSTKSLTSLSLFLWSIMLTNPSFCFSYNTFYTVNELAAIMDCGCPGACPSVSLWHMCKIAPLSPIVISGHKGS